MFIAGIVLLGVIAVGLAIFFYFVRQRQANEVARLEREREERRRRAAERRAQRELEARQRAASIPIKTVVPGARWGVDLWVRLKHAAQVSRVGLVMS